VELNSAIIISFGQFEIITQVLRLISDGFLYSLYGTALGNIKPYIFKREI